MCNIFVMVAVGYGVVIESEDDVKIWASELTGVEIRQTNGAQDIYTKQDLINSLQKKLTIICLIKGPEEERGWIANPGFSGMVEVLCFREKEAVTNTNPELRCNKMWRRGPLLWSFGSNEQIRFDHTRSFPTSAPVFHLTCRSNL